MDRDAIKIALASLTDNPGQIAGWETNIVKKLGELSEHDRKIISLASKLSAGITDPSIKNEGQLVNIFNGLSLDATNNKGASDKYISPKSLRLNKDALFPGSLHSKETQQSQYKSILDELKEAVDNGYSETESYVEYLLSVLHRTTWAIPSSFEADVSFYDQQRMTAALAICLHNKGTEQVTDLTTPSQPVTLLVGGDLSGIQDFIYTITAKGAAKSLRGRSFYLQLLTEAILRYVLRELDLTYTNVIYSGGGHFFLLAPVSKTDVLNDIQAKITRILIKHHGSSLYLALGSVEVPVSGFFEGRFTEYWGQMHSSMAQKKRQRYSELGSGLYQEIFVPKAHGGNPDETCSVCGEDHRKARKWNDLDTQENICSLCDSFIEEFGKKLPRNNFIALSFGATKSAEAKTASDALSEFGLSFQFIKDGRGAVQVDKENYTILWALDDPENGQWPSSKDLPQWIRYTANQVTPYSFDELLDKVEGGFERLGVLRMDVDRLGELFKSGFGKQATISRLAALSFRTSLFFEGWLKQLCEKDGRNELIYTVYAGGDDVFLIGPWDLIPALAQEIVTDFSEYTGQNSAVHLSAGMAFIGGKYPVYQAADDAKEAIDLAKALSEKNAFTFLGNPWPWPVFAEITKKQNQLNNLVAPKEKDKKAGPQAILQVLQQLAVQEAEHDKVKGRHVWGRWIWMGMYQLTRMQERHKELEGEINSIKTELQDNHYQSINQWGTAARWMELKGRKKMEDAK